MAHRPEADEGFVSSTVAVVDEDLTSASSSPVAATSTSLNGSSSSDDVILVTGDDVLEPALYLSNTRANANVAASSSASTSSSSNVNKDASVGASREADSSVVVASSSSTFSAESAASAVLDCPICLQTCIHPARLPCGHIFCFLCVKGVAYKNRRCAMCRREIPAEFLDHPQLVNGIDDICTTKATDDGYQWFYEGRNGWWQYDDRTSQDIEDAYRKGEKSCTILVAGYVYIVDLEAMLQQRQNEPTRCRHVKRDLATIPKKGVAGLRIEGNTVTTDSNFAATTLRAGGGGGGGSGTGADAGADNDDDDDDHEDAYTLRRRLLPTATSASDFISTIAATDAAIRIASDIIGSTLAHADEMSRGSTASNVPASSLTTAPTVAAAAVSNASSSGSALAANTSGEQYLNSSGSTAALTSTYNSTAAGRGSRELLGAAEDLLDATQSIISAADQRTIDLFEQTLNHFHALTLRGNIAANSSEEDEEAAGEVDADGGGNNASNSSAAGGANECGNGQMRF